MTGRVVIKAFTESLWSVKTDEVIMMKMALEPFF